jgi:hypothetical protein
MFAGRGPGAGLPVHWLAALDAVADACTAERAASAPTGLVGRRLRDADGSHTTRTLLRMLRRHGYLASIQDEKEGAPLRWTLTAAGRHARSKALMRQPKAPTRLRFPPRSDSPERRRDGGHEKLPVLGH